jgi:hypothetical protein
MGLSFKIAAGSRQPIHFLVQVPWDSRPYISVSDSRLPFLSPPTTRRGTVEVFDPASMREIGWPLNLSRLITLVIDCVENIAHWCSSVVAVEHVCFPSRYSATAALYLLIPRSLPSSGRCLYSHYWATGLHATIWKKTRWRQNKKE